MMDLSFSAQKGNPGSAQEIHTANTLSGLAGDAEELLTFETYIQGSSTSGLVQAEIAGPSLIGILFIGNKTRKKLLQMTLLAC